ncbi:MAG TPA: hypothetical protein DCS43_09850 [Verrucomicrobia bacterium]|nr:hypothetical protein [Verrucomicrobiota bacterium]
MRSTNPIRTVIDVLLFLYMLPLAGIVAGNKPIAPYLEFPPLTKHVHHAAFSWPVFIALAMLILAAVLPFVIRVLRSQPRQAATLPPQLPFPWWGWLGVAITGMTWVLAWTRFAWFAPLQAFTFSPLWFGYILIVNGLTWRRTGQCMLRNRPRYTAWLFIISAVFWWYFEYLNRFVQNWYYEGVGELSGMQYFIYATLPFATVLPAVLGTRDLLDTYPRLSCGLENFLPVRARRPRAWAAAVFALSCLGLMGIGRWPSLLYPLLWLAPLFVITALQCWRGQRTVFSDLATGNWRQVVLLALSALICGFFWELWNLHSQAKWIYSVPFVGRFKLFEMPILGFAGYLPFGLECAVVADFLLNPERRLPGGEQQHLPPTPPSRLSMTVVYGNHLIVEVFALYFLLLPGFLVMRDLADPRLKDDLIFAPELWPELAADWYTRYETYFWQKTWWADGWREYQRVLDPKFDSYMGDRLAYDVDAGPIIAGFSPAANAFGLAAAKINGRLDHAYTLGSQIIVSTWPLPSGSLLGPQLLSSRRHAPYLGEACIRFFLSQTPTKGATIITGGHAPGCVTIGYVFYFGTGLALLLMAGIGAWRYDGRTRKPLYLGRMSNLPSGLACWLPPLCWWQPTTPLWPSPHC